MKSLPFSYQLLDLFKYINRFILFCHGNEFWDRLFNIFDEKRYSWDDFKKIKRGYKPIMELETLDLSEIIVHR